jgi:hypothetical protein
VIFGLVSVVVVLAALGGAIYFSRSLKPRQRFVFWIVVVLGALLVVPQLYRGFRAGYRVGVGLREQDNR